MSKDRTRQATLWVDYQSRARQFRVHDVVCPRGLAPSMAGRVLAVWPGIGMVDVEFPQGATRMPVEDLYLVADADVHPPFAADNSVPGGSETVSNQPDLDRMIQRVASAHIKRALYWGGRDRKYRPSRGEVESGKFTCPKHPEAFLMPAIYQRVEGKSERLFGCPECMFLITRAALLGFED